MKKYFLFACVAAAMASCSSDDFFGNEGGLAQKNDGAILFKSYKSNAQRANLAGAAAADVLGKNFIVEGTKGATTTTATTQDVVFDNYLATYTANTAGTTESNTHNWEYVGVTESDHIAEAVLTGDAATAIQRTAVEQTIKYWDYSKDLYDFVAFSTGEKTMVAGTTAASTGKVHVTKIDDSDKSYQFAAVNAADLSSCYISDIVTVEKTNFGEPVVLQFKNLGAKIRMAVYETVPGYSVRNVEFYVDDTAAGAAYVPATVPANDSELAAANAISQLYTEAAGVYTPYNTYDSGVSAVYTKDGDPTAIAAATLFASSATLPTSGTINVTYPVVGWDNRTKKDWNKAQVSVAAVTGGSAASSTQTFGTVATSTYAAAEKAEKTAGDIWIGRSSNKATFFGTDDTQWYQNVIPNPNGETLTLRCNYTLESTDGSGEVINVWGAKAVVPATFTKWQPNYAYTYIFKISDKSNGSTEKLEGIENLVPITFDAVVAEWTDANAEQTTITTVATPSITTYQKGHKYTVDNEYSAAQGDIYVTVSNTADGSLYSNLATKGQLYTVTTTGDEISEASVTDALVRQTSATGDPATITGRNKIVLTPATSVADFTTIPGVDGKDINLGSAGKAAKFTAAGAATYAYVYDATSSSKTTVNQFQPVVTTTGTTVVTGKYSLAWSAIDVDANKVLTAEAASDDYVYFSVTTNGGAEKTYSYVTYKAGQTVPAGYYKVAKSVVLGNEVTAADTKAAASTFYFEKYVENNGVYGVKVIKVIA